MYPLAQRLFGVSIHAPVWGATWILLPLTALQPSFNPRSRMGSDYFLKFQHSMHLSFNPRSRMGSDFPLPSFVYEIFLFQSTLPYGERQNGRFCRLQSYSSFNPRSRMGSDLFYYCGSPAHGWFQSTLPYGERRSKQNRLSVAALFQSTLPYGERQKQVDSFNNWGGFNPRSRMGSDGSSGCNFTTIQVSIHAPVWGATGIGLRWMDRNPVFQSTLPYGERLTQAIRVHLYEHGFNPRSRMGSDGA